ncbi:carbon starvation protein A, partial [Pseudomonas ogarae]
LATVVLIKMKRQRYVWVTLLPASWLLSCTTTAGLLKLGDANPAIGVWALARKDNDARAAGQSLAPHATGDQVQLGVLNAYTYAPLTVLFLFVLCSIVFYALNGGSAAWGTHERTDKEAPFQALPDA